MSKKSHTQFDEAFVIVNRGTGKPIPNARYLIHRQDGSVLEGVTDAEGRTHLVVTDTTENLGIELLDGWLTAG